MKRREALTVLAGSIVALLPISTANANQKRRTIYCMQNGKVRKVTGVNPSCPVGWNRTSTKNGKAALRAQRQAEQNSGSGNSASPNTPNIPNNWVKLTTLAALPATTATKIASENIWLIKNGDEVTGFSGRCTHQGISVVARGAGFYCPGHGATYDKNGQNPTNPATRPLERARIEVANGDVYLVK
ncbi:MAG: Rieske 2Fe-2S domain-containing protein [Actinobacteria bacterium]|uniref:Unannotated protein n=1 Tax=freshwater metagenome TaxID=449393 RepID=A0A6J6EPE8_9ZZZZ|nr:Rieske 2Fe-2S domain-containing protein [Actinomycetota bacterium]